MPGTGDVGAIVDLVHRRELAVRGRASTRPEVIASQVVGAGSWTRHNQVWTDEHGVVRAWADVHDRARGRTNITLVVCPDTPAADGLAEAATTWIEQEARAVGLARGGLDTTQLDATLVEGDEQGARWLTRAGFSHTRTWLQMVRPVTADDAALPAPREGVLVRRVATHEDGMPVAEDVRSVHQVLEESFADHFNSYRESFAEFAARLREDPGHRWDHWWIADIQTDEGPALGGGLVSSVLPEDDRGRPGSYIDYIGVHRRARGRGVAKALLFTVIRDAVERGRGRVALEVDADSPTGADGLYESLGWRTAYRTQSWQRDLPIDTPRP